MLDSVHQTVPTDSADTSTYHCGRIGSHNVVMACLAQYGASNAAHVAALMTSSFSRLQMLLMVGIGGGAPTYCDDLRLGDVVIGRKVFRYWVKLTHDGRHDIKPMEQTVSQQIGTALAKMRAIHELQPSSLTEHVEAMLQANPDAAAYSRPTDCPDRLFVPHYTHHSEGQTCDECEHSMLVQRLERPNAHPRLHYGVIASGDFVVKDSARRDGFSRELRVPVLRWKPGASLIWSSEAYATIRIPIRVKSGSVRQRRLLQRTQKNCSSSARTRHHSMFQTTALLQVCGFPLTVYPDNR